MLRVNPLLHDALANDEDADVVATTDAEAEPVQGVQGVQGVRGVIVS
jgi:hypothetical protein